MKPFRTDYGGRLVDISIFQFESGERLQGDITLSYGNPVKIITGIEKLKQVFAVMFFTSVGSVLLDETRGTVFGEVAGQSNYDPDQIQHVANIATAETVNLIIQDQIDLPYSIPADETLVDATVRPLLENTQDPSHVILNIALVNASGAEFDVFLPLPIALS